MQTAEWRFGNGCVDRHLTSSLMEIRERLLKLWVTIGDTEQVLRIQMPPNEAPAKATSDNLISELFAVCEDIQSDIGEIEERLHKINDEIKRL